MTEFLDIGKIVNTHGVKGWIKVLPLTSKIDRYDLLKWLYVGDKKEIYHIENLRYVKKFVVLKFKGIDKIEQAEILKEKCISVDRENAVKLDEDEFFVCDLIGCKVYDEQGKLFGSVGEVISTGSNDVYVVKNEDRKDLLIPALKEVVKCICLDEKKIIVKLPEGLVEDEV